MFDRLIAGERLAIIRGSTLTPSSLGAVVRVDAGALVGVRLNTAPGDSVTLAQDEQITLVRAANGVRLTAEGAIRSNMGGLTWLRVAAPGWRPLQQRAAPRFSTSVRCEVAAFERPGPRSVALIQNVSAGGLRLRMDEHLNATRLEVYLQDGSSETAIVCVVLAVERFEDHVELRLRFDRLAPAQERAVEKLMGAPELSRAA